MCEGCKKRVGMSGREEMTEEGEKKGVKEKKEKVRRLKLGGL